MIFSWWLLWEILISIYVSNERIFITLHLAQRHSCLWYPNIFFSFIVFKIKVIMITLQTYSIFWGHPATNTSRWNQAPTRKSWGRKWTKSSFMINPGNCVSCDTGQKARNKTARTPMPRRNMSEMIFQSFWFCQNVFYIC